MSYSDYEERIDLTAGDYIVAGSIEFESILEKKPLEIGNTQINVGELTNLLGWFDEDIKYAGMLGNRAIFYLGRGDSNLFENGAEYYDVTYYFSSNHIGKCYKPGTFRDSYYKNGKWS